MLLPFMRYRVRLLSTSATEIPSKLQRELIPAGCRKWESNAVRGSVQRHPALVLRRNPFLEPIPAWLRDFKTFQPISLIKVSSKVFNAPIRIDIMHRVVHWYRAGLRAGTASTKHRSDVRGSTRKLYRQKGTGRARAGSSRAPHRRGGATCFGPKPRDWSYTLPEKLRNLGLRSALTAKFKQGELSFVSNASLALPSHKTKLLASMVSNVPSQRLLLLHAGEAKENLERAARNIKRHITIMDVCKEPVNVYHLLKRHFIVMTESARKRYETLFERLPY